jgi:phospholipid/cholesterol/gamma-HCH transport system substrate-binding protein
MNRGRDFLVGVVFFGLLIVLGVFTTILADFRFGTVPSTTVAFDRVDGLSEGAQVWINGVKSGKVTAVRRDPKRNKVLVDIEFDEEPDLNSKATFRVDSISLLGGKVVAIDNPAPAPGEAVTPLDISKRQEGQSPADVMGEVRRTARTLNGILEENRAKIGKTLDSVEDAAARIQKILDAKEGRIEATVDDLADAVRAAKGILEENRADLRTTMSGLVAVSTRLSSDGPKVLDRLKSASERIDGIARKIDEGKGLIATLLNDERLSEDVRQAVADIRGFAAGARSSKGTFGRLMNDPALYDEAVATVKSLRASADRIEAALGPNADQNVVGLLLTDREMAKNLKNSIAEVSRFLEDERENAPLTTFAGLLFTPF